VNIIEVEEILQQNDLVMVYFSGNNCGVCTALMPKIKESFTKNFPKMKQVYINANDFPKTAAHYNIFTIPSVLIFFENKETKRESRHISVDNLVLSTKRVYDIFFS